MEIIGYGILLAIGFYLAPVIVYGTIGVIALAFTGISNLFGGRR